MLTKFKKICRQNKMLYYVLGIFYYPMKEILLYKPKKECAQEALDMLYSRNLSTPTIFYFGVPMHKNMGDLAQSYCIKKYFEKFWPEYEVLAMRTYSTYSRAYRNALKQKIREEDIIFFQSGYCTQDKHLDHTMHKTILQEFKDTRIVFLPQTVLFKDKIEERRTSEIFNAHEHILFLARDAVSYSMAKKMFPKLKIECFPDIVTTLIGKINIPQQQRTGILFCMRNDYEQHYSDQDVTELRNRLKRIAPRVDLTDTSCSEYSMKELYEDFSRILRRKLIQFAGYQVIVTDRYHGTIFSIISNTPVIVLSSNDHKVKTGIDWFKGIYDNAFFSADSLEAVEGLCTAIITRNSNIENKPYFEEHYYSKLRKMADEL